MFRYVVCICCCLLACLERGEAVIHEIHSLQEITPELSAGSWLLLDLDDTLLAADYAMGRRAFWEHVSFTFRSMNQEEAKLRCFALPLMGYYLQQARFHLVDSQASAHIKNWQRSTVVIGCTARYQSAPFYHDYDQLSYRHLQQVDVDFTRSPLIPEGNLSATCYGYSKGILFSSGRLKGIALSAFLDDVGINPSKVILVDDMRHQVESVEQACAEKGIPFVGYLLLSKETNLTDEELVAIGNVQLHALLTKGLIPTDEQALQCAHEHPNRHHNFYIQSLIEHVTQH